MLPILPAILILLLNGPAAFDRMVESGRLPASLAALQGRIEAQDGQSILRALQEPGHELMLASLLSLSEDRSADLQETISRLLVLAGLEIDQRTDDRPVPASFEPDRPDPVLPGPPSAIYGRPLGRSDRTRDGPATL